jgi:hypothetical protein
MIKRAKKLTVRILIGIVGLCVIAFSALLLISGVFEPQKYLEPWSKNYAQQFKDPRIQLCADGLLAGSGHNMQPWKIKLDKNDPMVFYLYSDSKKMTDKVDPLSRQMMVTQGAFLEYVKVAGNESGYTTDIKLFPDGQYDESNLSKSMDTKPVAKVTLTKTAPQKSNLYDAIYQPDTNRGPYKTTKLTSDQQRLLEGLNNEDGISIKIYQDTDNLDKIGKYAMQSAGIEAALNRAIEESSAVFRANEFDKNKYRYGYSVEGQGTTGIMKHILQGLLTIFPSLNTGKASTDNFIKATQTSVDSTPAYVMIISNDNSREKQIESGMLYSRLILNAHTVGLAMQPLSQSIEEYPEMKDVYDHIHRDYAPDGGTIQMLLRVGQPINQTPLSMRRDINDLIVKN